MKKTDVLIVGAGACGLMLARKLALSGKSVRILEARDRVGGRIWPQPQSLFGYIADAGAEFVHGEAPVTKGLIAEAGLTFTVTEGEMWSMRDGAPTRAQNVMSMQDLLTEKLKELQEDVPITEFLERYFKGKEFEELCESVIKMVEGYDAADPKRMSTFSLRDEWLGGAEWKQGKIREGYAGLLSYLENECKRLGVEIQLDAHVASVSLRDDDVAVFCKDANFYETQQVVVTAALPTISAIQFTPPIPEKIEAIQKMGYGSAIKLLLKFTDAWWEGALGQDLSKMTFMLCNDDVRTWWTQHPEKQTTLTGWMAGPNTQEYASATDDELLELAFVSLENTFKVSNDILRKKLVASTVVNWPKDPLTLGAYSYTTPETAKARLELTTPVSGRLYFAGEALTFGKGASTVEGALSSGLESAERILGI